MNNELPLKLLSSTMKKLHRNLLILFALLCFLGAALTGDSADAQTGKTGQPTPPKKTKSTPTPDGKTAKKTPTSDKKTVKKIPAPPKTSTKIVPKKTPTPVKANVKPTPKKTPPVKPTVKSTAKNQTPVKKEIKKTYPQIIVNVASGRVRREPDLSAETLRTVALGTIFDSIDKNAQWFQVKLSGDDSGWISNTITSEYNAAQREKIYIAIADKYIKRDNLTFRDAAQAFDFLSRVTREINSGELGLKRLQILDAALRLIPNNKSEESPYKNFTDSNSDKIVYSEPAGAWYARSSLFWELHADNKDKPVGENVAWAAAENPTPGECEGYINCHLYRLRVTVGEYLNFYPNGKHSREALKTITDLLAPVAADARLKQTFSAPNDITDRAEFNKTLAELRAIVAKLPFVEKQKTLQQISAIAEGYR